MNVQDFERFDVQHLERLMQDHCEELETMTRNLQCVAKDLVKTLEKMLQDGFVDRLVSPLWDNINDSVSKIKQRELVVEREFAFLKENIQTVLNCFSMIKNPLPFSVDIVSGSPVIKTEPDLIHSD